MRGYFVATSPPESDEDKAFVDALAQRGFINLHSTRHFNSTTQDKFNEATRSVTRKIRMSTDEQKEKKRAYAQREDVKAKSKAYQSKPEVRERRRVLARRQRELLKHVSEEAIHKVLQAEREQAENQ